MIKISSIRIREFRGIRDLELDLQQQNFAACGPNGTGKSGIVDAIEFGLTGKISRLAGKGTGELSVTKHGPHVDFREKPDEAWVEIAFVVPSLGNKEASIRRTVKSQNSPHITPNDPDVLSALQSVSLHPEFVLSRRELIRYVIAEPGDRANEVQALLRLNDVEKVRKTLNKIANAAKAAVPALQRAEEESAKHLNVALGTAQLTLSEVLGAVNPRRIALGLAPLADLEPSTSLSDGVTTSPAVAAAQSLPKAQLVADAVGLKNAIAALAVSPFAAEASKLSADLRSLAEDAASLKGANRETLLTLALDQYDGEACPACGTELTPDVFIPHVKAKLEKLEHITKVKSELNERANGLLKTISFAGSSLSAMLQYADLFNPKIDLPALIALQASLREIYKSISGLSSLEGAATALDQARNLPAIESDLAALDAAIALLPDPTSQDAARQYLIIAQERLTAMRSARQNHREAKAKSDTAARVYEVFSWSTTTALEAIYDKVQDRFSEFYRRINSDDEGGFTARLTPSIGKLGFDVDFYGRGHFPPGAYHSEGHQDGMGLCLYLALMQHLQGGGFTLAVLDDVLMSVDRGHRREVCALLREQFAGTQFVFTTHDDVWLRHMNSEGIVKEKQVVHFKTWSVDSGPTEWNHVNVWTEIEAKRAAGDVPGAAATLRRYLEYLAGEASHRLRAPVEYRSDGQFMLGDLMPGALSGMRSALKKAKASANSWNSSEKMAEVALLEAEFSAAAAATAVEQWQLNASVHYNTWADLTSEDFNPVATAYEALARKFRCVSCDEMYRVSPERGPKEALRCSCGKMNLNLVAK